MKLVPASGEYMPECHLLDARREVSIRGHRTMAFAGHRRVGHVVGDIDGADVLCFFRFMGS